MTTIGRGGSSPFLGTNIFCLYFCGRLAQLVRAPRLHRGGQRFESSIAHLSLGNKICAEVAQSVEHVTENHGVGGSNPPLGTTKPRSCKSLQHGAPIQASLQ